jgi:hypothetical protein
MELKILYEHKNTVYSVFRSGFDAGACSGCVGGTRWLIVVESPIAGIKLSGK